MTGIKQSRLASLTESLLSTAAGFGLSLLCQATFLPLLGVTIALGQNLAFACIMTAVSIGRQYVLRRLFEALHIRRPLSAFAQAVIAERVRQVEVEGWSAEHDEQHAPGELAGAGACYAFNAGQALPLCDAAVAQLWPWSPAWWKPTGTRRDLVKAAALILAEGEKFDRARRVKR